MSAGWYSCPDARNLGPVEATCQEEACLMIERRAAGSRLNLPDDFAARVVADPFATAVQAVMLRDWLIEAEGPIEAGPDQTPEAWASWYAAKYGLRDFRRHPLTPEQAAAILGTVGANCSDCGTSYDDAGGAARGYPPLCGRCFTARLAEGR